MLFSDLVQKVQNRSFAAVFINTLTGLAIVNRAFGPNLGLRYDQLMLRQGINNCINLRLFLDRKEIFDKLVLTFRVHFLIYNISKKVIQVS